MPSTFVSSKSSKHYIFIYVFLFQKKKNIQITRKMVHKIRKTKGIKPREPRTDRKELDDATRHGIIICHMHEDTDADIARFYGKSRRAVAAVIERAKKRSNRDRIPLQALSNIQN